jgi:hypothetical protein
MDAVYSVPLSTNVSIGMLVIILVFTALGTGLKIYSKIKNSNCHSGCMDCTVNNEATV